MRPQARLLGMGVVAGTLLASAAHAGGTNLAWVDCAGEAGALSNRTFACDMNGGTETLVCSFVLNLDLPQASGNEIVLDFISQSSPLPAWWDMKETGSCRPTALSVGELFNANDIVCLDWAQGTSPGSNIVTWQGAGANCVAVPTKNATWGQLKGLYR